MSEDKNIIAEVKFKAFKKQYKNENIKVLMKKDLQKLKIDIK